MVFTDFVVDRALPAFQRTAVELPPVSGAGEYGFACGMNTVRARLIVEPGTDDQPAHGETIVNPYSGNTADPERVGVPNLANAEGGDDAEYDSAKKPPSASQPKPIPPNASASPRVPCMGYGEESIKVTLRPSCRAVKPTSPPREPPPMTSTVPARTPARSGGRERPRACATYARLRAAAGVHRWR